MSGGNVFGAAGNSIDASNIFRLFLLQSIKLTHPIEIESVLAHGCARIFTGCSRVAVGLYLIRNGWFAPSIATFTVSRLRFYVTWSHSGHGDASVAHVLVRGVVAVVSTPLSGAGFDS